MQYRQSKARRNGNSSEAPRPDVYTRVTEQVIAHLERGVRPWVKPWRAEHTDGRIVRPLRFNGLPYSGINILMLWGAALAEGFSAPTWMTFRQAKELGANVRKGEKGSLVVYANAVVRTETTDDGDEIEREIPFLKGYTVFNVEQIDGLPEQYYAKPEPQFDTRRADRACRRVLRRHASRRSARWAPSLLRTGRRLHSASAGRGLRGHRGVLFDAGARGLPSCRHPDYAAPVS